MPRSFVSRALAGAAVVAIAGSLCACDVPEPLRPVADLFSFPSVEEGLSTYTQSNATPLAAGALITEGTLTVGLQESSSLPLLTVGEDGQASGMDVDVASALAQQLGLKVAFVTVSDGASALGTTCDVVMGVSAESQLGQSSLVVGDYAEEATQFFHKGATGVSLVQDLSSKTVGYQAGSMSQTLLQTTGLVMEGTGYSNLNEVFEALEAGQIDYALCNAYSGAFIARQYADIYPAGLLDAPVALGVAISSQNTALADAVNTALQTVQSNGVGEIIAHKWVGETGQLTAADQIQDIPAPLAPEAPAEGEETPDATPAADDGSTAGSNAVTSV